MVVFDIIMNYQRAFAHGLMVTLELVMIVWSAGLVLGGALGIWGAKSWSNVGVFSRLISFVLSAVPILVILFWLHYPLQAILDIVIDPFYTAAFALSLINVFAVADIVCGSLRDFPTQYLLAAKVTGLTVKQTVLKIQLPLILRQILPGLLFLQVTMLHTTLFASLISVEEIFRVAQRISAQIYKPFEIYTALGILFLLICYGATLQIIDSFPFLTLKHAK